MFVSSLFSGDTETEWAAVSDAGEGSFWPSLLSSPHPRQTLWRELRVKSAQGAGEGQQLHKELGPVFEADVLVGGVELKCRTPCLVLIQTLTTLNNLSSYLLHDVFSDQHTWWLSHSSGAFQGLEFVEHALALRVMLSAISPNYFIYCSCLS